MATPPMATPKRPPTATVVPKTAIEQATLVLQNLPEKPRETLSLREAIAVMKGVITAALNKGYSYEEIAARLSETGVAIRASSLKRYLSEACKDSTAKFHQRRMKQLNRS